ncbi:MAG: CoA-transferase [Frankiales bacterium]|jgi:acyl CoA:acetate/3-ketoacid CoA transferase beta subunit|nr:CoA-transferase [Frankiales bacterium]MCW2586881.1 CoA-transferase [Frankiales bacterium]
MSDVTRAEVCAVACAEAFRGDGEILVSPMALVPSLGARLARETFEPDLLLSDGEASYVAGPWPLGGRPPATVEAWLPFRAVFDIVWAGRRHVMMGASQLDRFGNQNISCIGPFEKPTNQLLGVRGAPGNTVNHATSYWVPKHSPRVFVERVDMVSGVGTDKDGGPFHDLRRVVTDLAVLDLAGPGGTMRLLSVHPGVTVEDVQAATGFALHVDDVVESRLPTDEELRLIREVLDPKNLRAKEVAPA